MPRKKQKIEKANPEETAPEFFSQKIEDTPVKEQVIQKKYNKIPKTKDIREQIESIYENSKPMPPPPKKGSGKIKILFLTIFILAFLTAISWAGFFMFGQGPSFDENRIHLSAQTNKDLVVGQEFIYQIKIKNNGRTSLNSSVLSLRYPQGFEFISAEPVSTGTDHREWELGTLTTGEEITMNIKGIIWDDAQKETNLQMNLDYRPGDLNIEFQKISVFKKELSPLPLDLEINGPTEINNGIETPFNITLLNNSEEIINNLELFLNLPAGLKITSPLWKDSKLSVSSLPASSSTVLTMAILPTAASDSGLQTIQADLRIKNNNKSFLLQSFSKEIEISKSTLSLGVTANGTNEKQGINFGDKITFTIAYENNGNTDLKDVILKLILDTPSTDNKSLFDWTQIQDRFDGDITAEQLSPQIRRAVITWNKSHILGLANIKPQGKNSFEVSLPIKQKGEINSTKLTESITVVSAEAILNNKTTNQINLLSNSLNLILNSDLNLTSSVTFKESTELPLQIGKNEFDTKSIYGTVWTLTNSFHELTDLQITATLPENVDWGKNSSATAGELTFDETTKQIIWKLNRLPITFPKVTINFDLGLKSKEQNSDQEMILLEKTRIDAKDKVTGESILFWKDPLSVKP